MTKNQKIVIISCMIVLASTSIFTTLFSHGGRASEKEANAPTDPPVEIESVAKENAHEAEYTVVYVIEDATVYRSISNLEAIGNIAAGSTVNRVAVKSESWSIVEYNDELGYVESSALSNMLNNESDNANQEDEKDDKEVRDDKNIFDDLGYSEDGIYKIVDEEVHATSMVKLRKSPSANAKELAIVKLSDTMIRIGVGSNGWSRVILDGKEGYITSYYLSPTGEVEYKDVNEVVYATRTANIRNGPNTQAKMLGELKKGSSTVRLAIGSNGWSKVLLDGEIVYMYSLYLTTENPNGKDTTEIVDDANYEAVNDTVIATRKVNIRYGPDTDYPKVGSLEAGEEIERVGIGDNGWSKVKYNSIEVYIKSDYLKVKETPQETTETE